MSIKQFAAMAPSSPTIAPSSPTAYPTMGPAATAYVASSRSPTSGYRTTTSLPSKGSLRAPTYTQVGTPTRQMTPARVLNVQSGGNSLTLPMAPGPTRSPVSVATVGMPAPAPALAPVAAPAAVSAETFTAIKGTNGSATTEPPPAESKAKLNRRGTYTYVGDDPTTGVPSWECPSTTIHEEPFSQGMLSIVVLGASGDLAKKKTYPSLMDLYLNGFLPAWVSIVGFARSAQQPEEFRGKIKPWLLKFESNEAKVDMFLARCTYFKGAYDSPDDFARLNQTLDGLEDGNCDMFVAARHAQPGVANRLFYFAIPPDAFLSSATSIKASAMTTKGFNRLIVEKPFGHDFESAQKLVGDLGALFTEEYIYRIDHYLAKELVQNLYMFRFGNSFLEPGFNHHHVASVQITFKEPFGTEGRGGYFTNYGIIRDVIQNHLMQVLSIVAMEPPPRVQGEEAGTFVRDAKNNVLRCIAPIDLNEVVIGQYVGADGKPGYLEDDSIKDKEKATYVPTFAAVVLRINNPRWHGVPFVLKAGKALNERKVDVRIQYKDPPAGDHIFGGQSCARNELVMRLQPDESVYMKINVKEPGLATKPIQSEMDLSYKARYADIYNPDAYTRLILEALRGSQANFVRSDELLNSWKIFDPLLVALEKTEKRIPIPYAYGSRGPKEADQLLARAGGFKYESGYVWQSPSLRT
mmetsp:Transcript_148141/g.258485  ORF Transcript_148141/g.258485 Transcript_148141/m.258485 type:complete len:693 (+) Transcript_148141:100-2178(+)